ncbi:hypothetical protein EUGRSUZ_F03847 [Eucalyptus grandis]|uniref:Uncharacterized protein n=3 Tax=Eucalyptus grandis TaxID=71139 RepID=A0A059BX28_EUCGR|nr:hypothetical protein EUGRSUZ_F03847 [Eucalyptus grandis]KAK3427669.1 hypothetical protein EUGRSUZ_F03847 [Eucalyptus grandis]
MELRRPTTTTIHVPLLLLLAVLAIYHVGKAAALPGHATFVVYNSDKEKVYARVVEKSSSSGSMDYAIQPNGTGSIIFEQGKDYALFFATGCSEDKDGHIKDCHSGNCPESGCTAEHPPDAATMIYYKDGSVTTSTALGYNFGLHGVFQCNCDCSSISCIIPLNKCPSSSILEEWGSPVACKAGIGVPSCQDDTTAPSSYSPPSAGTSCFDNYIMKITVISPPKEL